LGLSSIEHEAVDQLPQERVSPAASRLNPIIGQEEKDS
jgi:hypothetical protein